MPEHEKGKTRATAWFGGITSSGDWVQAGWFSLVRLSEPSHVAAVRQLRRLISLN